MLAQAIKGYGHDIGYNFDIWEADYDQIDRLVLDTSSEFYQFNPEFVVLSCLGRKSWA